MTDVSIVMPAGFTDPRRQVIQHWVEARWQTLFPKWEFRVGWDDEHNYNRSRARNTAVSDSTGEFLILTDADTVCNNMIVDRALDRVRKGAPWVIAHTVYYSLTKEYSDLILAQPVDVHLDTPFPDQANWIMRNKSQAGVLVMPREAYYKVNGYDERFQGWGYEDNHFALKMDRLWGHHIRQQGAMLHLWHDPGENFDQPHIAHNERLYNEARDAL